MYEKAPIIIAEIGCNHKGDFEIAKQLILTAKNFCGVDVVKFQKRNNKELLSPEEYNAPHPNPSNSYGETYGAHREFLEFTAEQHRELKAYCEEIGIEYSTSVWDLTSAKEITALNPSLIKIPSACNLNFEMLGYLCDNFSGEIHFSVGTTTQEEEDKIVDFLVQKGRAKDAVLYSCTSGYPVDFEDVCLLEITRLRERFGDIVKDIGFSGHHNGIAIDNVAYALGANYVERHFTLNRTWKGTDHAASLEPDGMRRLVRDLHATRASLGYKKQQVLPVEEVQKKEAQKRYLKVMSTNKNKELLLSLGLVSEDTIIALAGQVRDRDDVGVLIDKKSNIIFLDRSDHLDITHYETMGDGSYWGGQDRQSALKNYAADDIRRFEQFRQLIEGKDIADVGCGTGGFMDLVKPVCNTVTGVEPQEKIRIGLESLGYKMYRLPENLPENSFDVVTLFHTLEHLVDPLSVLQSVKASLKSHGKVIIEVPHAKDALLALESFRNFSFWSEHMILHTRQSLEKILSASGFRNIEVFGYQRYSMVNHLGWLISGLPGGQNKYQDLQPDNDIQLSYEKYLIDNDKTDTIIAIAQI